MKRFMKIPRTLRECAGLLVIFAAVVGCQSDVGTALPQTNDLDARDSSSTTAERTIATNSWEFVAPEGWVVDLSTKPVKAKGPHGELLHFSSYHIPALSDGAEAQAVRAQVEGNAIAVMESAAAEEGLQSTTPMRSSVLTGGVVFYEIVSTSTDGNRHFAQFAMIGPRAAMLVTLELPGSAITSIEAVRSALSATTFTQ